MKMKTFLSFYWVSTFNLITGSAKKAATTHTICLAKLKSFPGFSPLLYVFGYDFEVDIEDRAVEHRNVKWKSFDFSFLFFLRLCWLWLTLGAFRSSVQYWLFLFNGIKKVIRAILSRLTVFVAVIVYVRHCNARRESEEIQSKSNENYLINRNRYFMRPHPLDRILGEDGNGKEQNDDVMSFGRDLIFFCHFFSFQKDISMKIVHRTR